MMFPFAVSASCNYNFPGTLQENVVYPEGETVPITCKEGYLNKTHVEYYTTCGSNGQWSPILTCQSKASHLLFSSFHHWYLPTLELQLLIPTIEIASPIVFAPWGFISWQHLRYQLATVCMYSKLLVLYLGTPTILPLWHRCYPTR